MLFKLMLTLLYCVHQIIATDVLVTTSSGVVKGRTLTVLNQKVDEFLAIPYAQPPVGKLRFAKPKPLAKPIKGVIDATKPGHSCWQIPFMATSPMSEDCLVLNIWSQTSDSHSSQLKPVMFFIHGGAFIMGSIFSQMPINGTVLAKQDVVVVAVNYRLGYFGFLYGGQPSAPGNAGIYDQLLALKWVHKNIHLFGGDKNQITIFGQSAGSQSVSVHMLSPLSRGLFKRAILLSGALYYSKRTSVSDTEDALANARRLAIAVNCTDDRTWLSCMRQVAPQQIVQASLTTTYVLPTEGTELLPLRAQQALNSNKFNKGIDVIAGITRDEGTILAPIIVDPTMAKRTNFTVDYFKTYFKITKSFLKSLDIEKVTNFYLKNVDPSDSEAIKRRIIEFTGDVVMKCPTYLFAKQYAQKSNNKDNVFFYELTYAADDSLGSNLTPPGSGVFHGADMPFTFGTAQLRPNLATPTDIEFSKRVVQWWTSFAKFGKPDNSWRPLLVGTSRRPTAIRELNPNATNKYFTKLFKNTCDGFWRDYFQ